MAKKTTKKTIKSKSPKKASKTAKPWGGRFTEATDRLVEEYTASIPYDWRLYPYDIAGSIAHATMLSRTGIITKKESARIVSGLEGI
ncbi:MAG TPA: argininosuccinate lyase, partial [Nitrospirota bacterium]|nr:argininosuccinate lyase [Nitrospirota bacterium]